MASGELWIATPDKAITTTQLTTRTANFQVVFDYDSQPGQLHLLFYNLSGAVIPPGDGSVVELWGNLSKTSPLITKALLADSTGTALPVSWSKRPEESAKTMIFLPIIVK